MVALLPRVKSRLFIHANRRTTNLLEGEYAAISAGRSLDFDDLREYLPGDDVDDIDWKATARTGSPLVKRYKQTRRHDVVLAIDTGRGMAAAAEGGGPKRDLAILVAGALGYLSLRHGDAVGLVTRAGGRVRNRPPRASEAYLETLLRSVQNETRLDAAPGDPYELCSYLLRGVPSRSIVIVVADDVEPAPDIDEALRSLRERHELLWITIGDLDLVRGDGSDREILDVLDGSPVPSVLREDPRLARVYRRRTDDRIAAQHAYFRSRGVSHCRVATADEVVPELLRLLQRRRRNGY
ncbi:MAG: DUF58 domain-containing protein [Microbacteriaceae bacterium]|nr:DUF58 domain-containing protein [Microbacteriaceae bacterium]